MPKLKPEEFMTALKKNSFADFTAVVGMVKEATAGNMISFGLSCAGWIDIPLGLIDSVEYLGKTGCNGHEHVRARVHLKEPTSDEARVLARLLSQSRDSARTGPELSEAMLVAEAYERPPLMQQCDNARDRAFRLALVMGLPPDEAKARGDAAFLACAGRVL